MKPVKNECRWNIIKLLGFKRIWSFFKMIWPEKKFKGLKGLFKTLNIEE